MKIKYTYEEYKDVRNLIFTVNNLKITKTRWLYRTKGYKLVIGEDTKGNKWYWFEKR